MPKRIGKALLVKFFRRGTGGGASPTAYLMQPMDANGRRREPLPECLGGDPQLCARLIDSIDRKHKYSSGVLAFHKDDKPTPEQQAEAMREFERAAFAGLESDQYHCLWVKHEHCGNVELHFVTPKIELRTGKQLNIKPPGTTKFFDAWRDFMNAKHNWADPLEPERKQDFKLDHNQSLTWKQAKTVLNTYLAQQKDIALENGLDYTRETLVSDLNALNGVSISKTNERSVSVMVDGFKQPMRLNGATYEQQFSAACAVDRAEAARENRPSEADRSARSERLGRELEKKIAGRRELYAERYVKTVRTFPESGRDTSRLDTSSCQDSQRDNREAKRSRSPHGSDADKDFRETEEIEREAPRDKMEHQERHKVDLNYPRWDFHNGHGLNAWNSYFSRSIEVKNESKSKNTRSKSADTKRYEERRSNQSDKRARLNNDHERDRNFREQFIRLVEIAKQGAIRLKQLRDRIIQHQREFTAAKENERANNRSVENGHRQAGSAEIGSIQDRINISKGRTEKMAYVNDWLMYTKELQKEKNRQYQTTRSSGPSFGM